MSFLEEWWQFERSGFFAGDAASIADSTPGFLQQAAAIGPHESPGSALGVLRAGTLA
jgi:hypothetical protein